MTAAATATRVPMTPARLAAQTARCRTQREMADRVCRQARHRLDDALLRRDRARSRAGDRIVPMWQARRACYDRLGPIVAMCSDGRTSGEEGPAPAPDGSLAHPWTDLAEGIVNRLFAVSLVVTSARSTLSGIRAERLDQAVEMLDLLIRDVRRSVWRDMTSESWDLQHRPGTLTRTGDPAPAGGAEVPPAAGETSGPA